VNHLFGLLRGMFGPFSRAVWRHLEYHGRIMFALDPSLDTLDETDRRSLLMTATDVGPLEPDNQPRLALPPGV
jgi:hypothetical protein